MFVSSCLCLKYFSEGRVIGEKKVKTFKVAHFFKILPVARIQCSLILHLGYKLSQWSLREAMWYVRKSNRTGVKDMTRDPCHEQVMKAG